MGEPQNEQRAGRQLEGSVVLIGPPGVGKSTVAPLLGTALGLPVVDLDTLRWAYYDEAGYNTAYATQLVEQEGLRALLAYWKPFELHAVERAMRDYPAHVIAFGAGHSFYQDPVQHERAQRALAAAAAVVLLVPSQNVSSAATLLGTRIPGQDVDSAAALLAARIPADTPFAAVLREVQAEMLAHPSNRSLATLTVATEGRTPAEVCAAIQEQLVVQQVPKS